MIEKRILKSGRPSWRVRWWHGQRERSKSFKTRREAEHFDRERIQSQDSGTWVDPQRGKMLVKELFKEYIKAQIHLKAGTIAGYETEYQLRIEPEWGMAPLTSVTKEGVQRWVQELSAKVGASTVRYAHRVLSLMLDFAISTKRIRNNPAKAINLPRLEPSKRFYLPPDVVMALDQKLRQTSNDSVYADIVTVMALTGLRVGEATALSVEDYDPIRRRLRVSKAYRQISGKYVLGTPKTQAGYRQIAAPQTAANILNDRVEGAEFTDHIFMTERGKIVRPENLRRATGWKNTVSELGYPGLTLHDLRHTAASLAVHAGSNVKVVQRMLGHSSATITLDVYADLFDSELDDVAQRLDDLILTSNPATTRPQQEKERLKNRSFS